MYPHITIITHNGSFHSDDLFAVATLLLLLEKKPVTVEIVRSRDQNVIAKGDFVVDVGGVYDEAKNRFDHHQQGGAGQRSNNVPYAAFGLVWKKFGVEISGGDAIALVVDMMLVQSIDFGDNRGLPLPEIAPGVYPYTLDRMIGVFVSTYGERDRKEDDVFLELLPVVKNVLSREIEKARSIEHARVSVERLYNEAQDKRIVVLDDEYPWYPILIKHPDPLFVVFPDGKSGNWGISSVRKGLYNFENRKDFPKDWAGKRDAELAVVSGVADAAFCHNRLFFAVAKTKEGAIALAYKALVS